MFRFLLAVVLMMCAAQAQTRDSRALLLISIDGMGPEYVHSADRYQLKIPKLRQLYAAGAHARGVRGVFPTVTYPSHTTLMTGVWPAKHGIPANTLFDPLGKNTGAWFWYSEDIRVPTLWETAKKAGYSTASVSWPVTAGARGIDWLIPEYWRNSTSEDLKLMRLLATPGLMNEIEKQTGPYVTDLNDAIPGDQARTHYAEAIMRTRKPRFMAVHLAALDHLEHAAGPFSREALSTLEQIDRMIEALDRAMHAAYPNAAVAIVSDHGFAPVAHQLDLRSAFQKAGLMGATDWQAAPWEMGGMALIVLKDPGARSGVEKLLRDLKADGSNGIAAILTRSEIAAMGGTPQAEFAVDMKPGFAVGTGSSRGAHGYAPSHPELLASFFIAGPGVGRDLDLGEIDMRSVAPTLARYLGFDFPGTHQPALRLTK